jgi:hypothetical protein
MTERTENLISRRQALAYIGATGGMALLGAGGAKTLQSIAEWANHSPETNYYRYGDIYVKGQDTTIHYRGIPIRTHLNPEAFNSSIHAITNRLKNADGFKNNIKEHGMKVALYANTENFADFNVFTQEIQLSPDFLTEYLKASINKQTGWLAAYENVINHEIIHRMQWGTRQREVGWEYAAKSGIPTATYLAAEKAAGLLTNSGADAGSLGNSKDQSIRIIPSAIIAGVVGIKTAPSPIEKRAYLDSATITRAPETQIHRGQYLQFTRA